MQPVNDEQLDACLSDPELMQRLAHGQREALTTLVDRYQARVLALAFRFLGDWQAAEDVAQETFLRVFRGAATYTPDARFTTWLFRIVANLCWDQRRKAARLPDLYFRQCQQPGATELLPPLEKQERQERVQQAVAQLADRQRLALILHRYEGLTHAEISRVTGWSVGAVESCLVRAYDRLRDLLADLRTK